MNLKTYKLIDLKTNRGFVVLFTVLISSIILAIALGVSSIALGEVLLSSSAKEGNVSFFAADTGAECALFWDIVQDKIANPLPLCSGFDVDSFSTTPYFLFNLDLNDGTNCARVSVEKDLISQQGLEFDTRIESRGYNVDCEHIPGNPFGNPVNPRAIERAIKVIY